MSGIEYNSLLFKISRRLDQLDVREELLFMCRGKVSSGIEDINNSLSLFRKLEDHDHLEIDRLEVLKELLKGVEEWSLFQKVKKFEIRRKEYKCLLEEISRELDENNHLEQLVLICRRKTSVESQGNIHDVGTLFKELERQNYLGFARLDFLKEILTETEKEDLLKKVQDFEKKRNEEDEFERRKAQAADIVASARAVGGKIIGVLNMKTVCRVAAAGITLLTVREVLTRWSTYDQLVTCFNDCVLPAGTQLIDVSQGCVCFTAQADNLTGLTSLWNMYQDGTLRARLRDFFVTDEMEKRAGGGDNVEVTVTIEEEEYKKACIEFINGDKGEAKPPESQRGNRRHSDSVLSVKPKEDEVSLIKLRQLENKVEILQERMDIIEKEMEKPPLELLETRSTKDKMASSEGITEVEQERDDGKEWLENECLDQEKLEYIKKYLDGMQPETHSVITDKSDSGLGTRGTPSEIGVEDISGVARPTSNSGLGTHRTPSEHTEKDISERAIHQRKRTGGLRPPKRPGYGTVGRPIKLSANFFRLNVSSELTDLYNYDVEITPNKCPRAVKRDVVNEIIRKYKDTTFQGHQPAFDGEKNLYSRIKLPPAELSVKLPGEDGGKDREFKIKIQFAAPVSLLELKNFLSGKQNGKVPQDAVQALDIVMRQMPSLYYTPVGRSFFPDDGRGKPLGEGCEVKFGFYSSIRHSEWKAMLLNIDVSAKGFYKSQPVIPDFVCETVGVSPQNLQDPRFPNPADKRKLEEAIHGIRVQTSHSSYKRKYSVWGVSDLSADKLQFVVEEQVSGRKYKTTVAEYFKDTYKLPLRYPHLPCLLVGQKKDRYLPLELCTIVPCHKRYLTEQQIANMIRSTARPAPERQQNIQYWAQEMIKASSKYLREEFKTSISTEMVKVDGRVLPAPKLNLGPQDQALVPRDGSWDMRNKSLHDGARIQTWALACFAPSRWCNEDHLRNFSKQMASVSCREGMRMVEEPVVVRYAKGYSDVESLFSKFAVDHPELQLIMAVLPERSKHLYPEIKRVGDNVLGIATQCVQSKHVQQAKPQLCSNISLKINAKLGGVNYVIDPSIKSPVFREPVIIFGADVTQPSPIENEIPSIAAVVASMDANATKYCARVRAQRHEKLGGAQEIINDLATMVKELLIEFYKANRRRKPSRIIFYRDGVSEGQFDQVLVHEVRAVQEACMMLEKEYRPRITFIVVQKRHHTRLFCEDKRDASGKAQNVPPGTTVDSGITHPYEFDFYLCSHFGIQGTSRPTHYHVLYDDNGFTADSLQQLTYQLCHVYARCTKSVSMPAPAYYAHLVAFRARHHVTNGGNGRGGNTVDLEKSAKAIEVNAKMKGAMYFT
ncbi:protein argonaute-2-like isoform X2 [Oculina patagonica]